MLVMYVESDAFGFCSVWHEGLIQLPSLHTVLNAMAVEDYRKNHWPNLEKAVDRLLIQNPTDHISVSYAQIYRWDSTSKGMLNKHPSELDTPPPSDYDFCCHKKRHIYYHVINWEF